MKNSLKHTDRVKSKANLEIWIVNDIPAIRDKKDLCGTRRQMQALNVKS